MSDQIIKAEYGAADKPLRIGEIEIPCYVLEDGRRVIVQRGLFKALGIQQGGSTSGKHKEFGGAARIASFLEKNGLISFNPNGLGVLQNPIIFKVNNIDYYGYEATILQEITRAISKAYLKGELPDRDKNIGQNAEILDDAFAKVGIIALVDEATGYQHKREKDELQKILSAYIAPELLPWQKKFPDEFYKEIFRLNQWDYTVKGIKQRPGVIGTWTKQLVYQQLPDGVLKELYHKTPKNQAGKLVARLHQSLTADIGNPHLEKQLVSVITLMNISKDWKDFLKFFNKKFGQQELNFPDIEELPKEEEKKEKLSDFNQKLKHALNYNPKGGKE